MASEYTDVTLSTDQLRSLVLVLSSADKFPGLCPTTEDYQSLMASKSAFQAALEETEAVVAKRQKRATSLLNAGLR